MAICAKCRATVEPIQLENIQLHADVSHRNQIITDALAAMNKGEYGSARRILTSGKAAPPMTSTGVIAKDGP